VSFKSLQAVVTLTLVV